jgi:uncharacterized protein
MKITVTVKSSAKENKVDLPKIFVKEPAKEGRANETIKMLLAKHFNVSKSRINIVLGLKSKKKVIEIK